MHHPRFSSQALPLGRAMKRAETTDVAWCRQNLVEVVHLAALHLHSKSDTFTLTELVKVARDFYRDPKLTDSLVAAVLCDACVEADLNSGSLRLAA